MLRLSVIIVTGVACFGAGTTAALAAAASELRWLLSDINFRGFLRLGMGWGIVSALIATIALSLVERKHLWITVLVAIVATWLLTCAGVWWLVVSSLG